MKLSVDKKIYSEACISKTVYALSEFFIIERHTVSQYEEEWNFETENEDEARAMVIRTLNDYHLRCIIEKETHDIRTILYAKSFADCEDVDENDLD